MQIEEELEQDDLTLSEGGDNPGEEDDASNDALMRAVSEELGSSEGAGGEERDDLDWDTDDEAEEGDDDEDQVEAEEAEDGGDADEDDDEVADEPEAEAGEGQEETDYRALYEQTRSQLEQAQPFIQAGQAFAQRPDLWGQQPQKPQGPDPLVMDAVRFALTNNDAEAVQKKFAGLPESVQREAVAKIRETRERETELLLDPQAFASKYILPTVQPQIEQINQRYHWEQFTLLNADVIQTPEDSEWIATRIRAGSKPADAVEILRATKERQQLAEQSKVVKRERKDHKARQNSRRAKAAKGGNRRGKPKFNQKAIDGSQHDFVEEFLRVHGVDLEE